MPPVGFEPTISAGERPQTYALDRAATGTGNSVSLPWVIFYEAFYLHIISSFSCIPVICVKLMLFLIPLQFVYLFCNLSKCVSGTTS